MTRVEYIQLGPSCDLDENGDPKPPKYVKAHIDTSKPFVRRIGKSNRKRRAQ
jgi:hypothetical protein